jgi:hypothetical protein
LRRHWNAIFLLSEVAKIGGLGLQSSEYHTQINHPSDESRATTGWDTLPKFLCQNLGCEKPREGKPSREKFKKSNEPKMAFPRGFEPLLLP